MSVHVRELSGDDFAAYQAAVCALEHGVTSPLGHDRFAIDHGSDYFAFFRRLGGLAYFVALDALRGPGISELLGRLPGARRFVR